VNTTLILQENAKWFLKERPKLQENVINSEKFKAARVFLYREEILENLYYILKLLDRSGCEDFLSENEIRSVVDVGGANGDLSFVFSKSGFRTTLVDMATPAGLNGPLVASLINDQLKANVRVVDFDVDRYFCYSDLIEHTVNSGAFDHCEPEEMYDLVICVGLLYHLRNPLAFLNSLAKICRFCVLGTFCMSYLPDNVTRIRDIPIAYLLDGELANDPTNHWIMTHASYERMVKISGFEVITNIVDFGRADQVSNAIDKNCYEREFLLVKSMAVS
jgi:2-polyprenyl-3-methyl-5-hydroxy-6-metoxy-1,4-benzoquinol methylase